MIWNKYSEPDITKFIFVSPLGDQRDWLTPYNYVQNNPILRVDPTRIIDDYHGIVKDELVLLGSDR